MTKVLIRSSKSTKVYSVVNPQVTSEISSLNEAGVTSSGDLSTTPIEKSKSASPKESEERITETPRKPPPVILTTETRVDSRGESHFESNTALDKEAEKPKGLLSRDLEQQLDKLSKLFQVEYDAYSPSIAEAYFDYGKLLQEDQQYAEAKKAFKSALHIEKINTGVYSLEQRNILKYLFEVNFALDDEESFSENVERILWLERHHEHRDTFSYEVLTKAGDYYIDKYFFDGRLDKGALQTLHKAEQYFSIVLTKYETLSFDEVHLPYGELAYINFLKGRILSTGDVLGRAENLKFHRRDRLGEFGQKAPHNFLSVAKTKSEHYMNRYLAKARIEGNDTHIVQALINIGDHHLLYQQREPAHRYYNLAWKQLQKLAPDDKLHEALSSPRILPNYNLASYGNRLKNDKRYIFVPVKFRVTQNGRVVKVERGSEDEKYSKYFTSARRNIKRLTFRPAIINGQVVDLDDVEYPVRVLIRKNRNQRSTAS